MDAEIEILDRIWNEWGRRRQLLYADQDGT